MAESMKSLLFIIFSTPLAGPPQQHCSETKRRAETGWEPDSGNAWKGRCSEEVGYGQKTKVLNQMFVVEPYHDICNSIEDISLLLAFISLRPAALTSLSPTSIGVSSHRQSRVKSQPSRDTSIQKKLYGIQFTAASFLIQLLDCHMVFAYLQRFKYFPQSNNLQCSHIKLRFI